MQAAMQCSDDCIRPNPVAAPFPVQTVPISTDSISHVLSSIAVQLPVQFPGVVSNPVGCHEHHCDTDAREPNMHTRAPERVLAVCTSNWIASTPQRRQRFSLLETFFLRSIPEPDQPQLYRNNTFRLSANAILKLLMLNCCGDYAGPLCRTMARLNERYDYLSSSKGSHYCDCMALGGCTEHMLSQMCRRANVNALQDPQKKHAVQQ